MKRFLINFVTIGAVYFAVISCSKKDENCIEKIEEECKCITSYEPVCGCNGVTYDNDCIAECSGITEFAPGACE